MVALLVASTAAAQVRPWVDVSPMWGAASAVAVDPQDSRTVLAVLGNDVWKSTDGGDSWATTSPIPPAPSDQPTGGREILAIGVSDSAVYVSAEVVNYDFACLRAPYLGCVYRVNVFKSTDGGGSWSTVFDGEGVQTYAWTAPNRFVAVDRRASGTVFVGSRDGMLKSIDAGASWSHLGSGIPANARIHTLILHPNDPAIMYVAGASHDEASGGVLESADGGQSFTPASTGLTDAYADVRALAIDPTTPTTLYAGTAGGIAQSIDGAATWAPYGAAVPAPVRALAIHPSRAGTGWAGTDNGIFTTTDGGATWTPAGSALAGLANGYEVSALAVAPSDSDLVYAGANPLCVVRSPDAGRTWTLSPRGGCHPFPVSYLAADPNSPTGIYAAAPLRWIYRSADGGRTWTPVDTGLSLFNEIAIEPGTGNFYVAGRRVPFSGNSLVRSVDGGRSWEPLADVVDGLGLIFEPNRLYVRGSALHGGPSYVLTSEDRGRTWQYFVDFETPLIEGRAFAVDPSALRTFYAQLYGGGFARTTNGGLRWDRIDAGIPLPNPKLTSIAVDPREPARLYVSVGEPPSSLFASADRGASWRALEQPGPITDIGINPTTSEVYAVSRNHVFASPPGGTSWRAISTPAEYATVPVIDTQGGALYLYGIGVRRLALAGCRANDQSPGCGPLNGSFHARLRGERPTLAIRGRRVFIAEPANGLTAIAAIGALVVHRTWSQADCRGRKRRFVCEREGDRVDLRAVGASTYRMRLRIAAPYTTGIGETMILSLIDASAERTGTLSHCARRRSGLRCRS